MGGLPRKILNSQFVFLSLVRCVLAECRLRNCSLFDRLHYDTERRRASIKFCDGPDRLSMNFVDVSFGVPARRGTPTPAQGTLSR